MSITFTPISRLPPELLSLIFCHVRYIIDADWDKSRHSVAFGDPFESQWEFEVKAWMKISHVCHAWREVAMNTVLLWSTLAVTRSNYKWAEESLRRSKRSSLVVLADFHQVDKEHPSRALLRELKNHLGRCRILYLRLTTGDLMDLLSQTDTPHLVHFHYCYFSESPTDPRDSPPLISDSILRASADSLRRLSISRCHIDWSASIFHRLTHLQLHYIPEESQLKFHAFTSFLLGIPSLEYLDLRNSLQEGTSDTSHPVSQKADGKHLQNLKHVELDDSPPNIARFISTLPIPPLCKVLIDVEGYPDTAAEVFSSVFSWVHRHFQPPELSSTTSDTRQNYWRSLRIFHLDYICGFQGYAITKNLEPNEILFEHCMWLPEDAGVDYEVPDLPQLLFLLLPISHIVYLEIASNNQTSVLSTSTWIEIFGSLSMLDSICLEAMALPFFEALSHNSDLFPVLSSVIVRSDDHLDYDAVLWSLHWRFQRGAPLKRLAIEGCPTVPSSVLKLLRMVVEQVTVMENRWEIVETVG